MSEERKVSVTGGAKGQKLARYDLIPTFSLEKLAEQYGRGARKYDERNWERGYEWSLSYAALQRHLNAFWDGEDYDYDDDEWDDMDVPHHLDAAMFHVMALRHFAMFNPEFDDRPSTLRAKARGKKRLAEDVFEVFGEALREEKARTRGFIGAPGSEQATDLRRIGAV